MKSYNPSKIGVFGSFARGDYDQNSDIDIAYTFEKGISYFEKYDLEHVLQRKLNRKVDLVSFGAIHPLLKVRILNEMKIIFDESNR